MRGSSSLRRVKFQVAHDVNRLRAAADLAQPRGVLFVLRADAGERGEQRPEQEAKSFVAAERAVGQPGVGQKHRDAELSRARQMKFGQISASTRTMASGLMVASARTTYLRRSIGIVNFADVRGQMAAQLGHAGGRGGGHDDFDVGQARFQRADELRAEIDFADADGVEPDDVAVRQRLLEVRVVSGRSAGKSREASCRAATSA